jgi:hypothetical protein
MDARQELLFVAHSLGCRVVLEALRSAGDKSTRDGVSGARAGVAAFMAAAVPNELCGSGGDFAAAPNNSRQAVLYSARDRVLSRFFPLGQAIYGERGEPVGRHGRPWGRWSNRMDTQLGHGEYWADSSVREFLVDFLADRAPRRREISERLSPEQRVSRRVLSRRSIKARSLGDPTDAEWRACYPSLDSNAS